MKTRLSDWSGKTSRVSFCSAASEVQSIEIAGQILVPNEDTAYVEFYMCHGFPVQTKYRTGVLPQVVANSYRTLNHKVFNLAHLMRKYNPKANPRDRILGTVVAVEFPNPPGAMECTCGCAFDFWEQAESEGRSAGGRKCPECELLWQPPLWTVTSLAQAPGIRAVAALHKAAESVMDILTSWFTGQNPQGGAWTVSMENNFFEEEGGFLVTGVAGVEDYAAGTPADLKALGYTYVPAVTAPELLLGCLNNADDDQRDGINSARICRDYLGQGVVFLLGGLDGKIRYRGVGLTPAEGAREAEARVSQMLASSPMVEVDVTEALSPLGNLLKTLG